MKGLTDQEQDNVRSALHFLRVRTGGWAPLAKVLGFSSDTLVSVKKRKLGVSVNMAFQVSRLVMVPFDDLLAGKYPAPGTCPYCGHCAPTCDEKAA